MAEENKNKKFDSDSLQFMETDTVAIIGPQASVMAHVLSHVVNELQTSPSDAFQMTAIANIVTHFGWREVIAIYTDDDHGRKVSLH
ncbi:hypothetical protein IFM89_010778 [Coptis chinensis]|uniref:Receptor ligand binding region domain-containing protein n=1 Tax=Coptis chinensis TaxID=261450 RepID=A0A835IV47_9MAGN|nr:hypothetical protein IFM89_010778 [Coptis chinensis]